MFGLKNNIMRLLIGASFILGITLGSDKFRSSTFLFCLQPTDKPLSVTRDGSSFSVDNSSLSRVLHKAGVINIEPWISSATDRDHYKDIYLNRIYRAYVDSDRDNVENIMMEINSSYPLLYVERENVHRLHYEPNDPSYDQQCSMLSLIHI